MAVLNVPNRMVYWSIFLSGIDSTILVKNIVNNFEITYEINKVSIASISILSQNYVSDLFTIGQTVVIKMGFSKLDQVVMFTGKIRTLPNGDASDHLSYNIIVHSTESELSIKELNKVHLYKTKTSIINAVCKTAGLSIKKIQIKDNILPTIQHVPIQNKQTVFEFLIACAEKWGCEFFMTIKQKGIGRPSFNSLVTDNIQQMEVVFCDREDAYMEGDKLYKKKQEILNGTVGPSGAYMLGYRTNAALNNIAKISWKFKPPKNKKSSSFNGTNEDGEKSSKYTIDSFNTATGEQERWELLPTLQKEAKKDKRIMSKYAKLVWNNPDYSDEDGYGSTSAIANREALHKYFIRKSVGSRTDGYKHGNGDTLDITVELNIGDPSLRPFRTALLKHGSLDPKAVSAFLPQWLWSKGKSPSFNIYKVKTSLSNGKIYTILNMKRG